MEARELSLEQAINASPRRYSSPMNSKSDRFTSSFTYRYARGLPMQALLGRCLLGSLKARCLLNI